MYSDKIFKEFGLKVKVAGEIEFYLTSQLSDPDEDEFLSTLFSDLAKNKIKIWNIQKEVAPNQYEVALQPTEPKQSIKEIEQLKNIISKTAKIFKTEAIFKAKPFENLPGCGLHIHIGVKDTNENSVLERVGAFANRESESEVMLNIIGGLCSTMLKNFIYFAPNEESYKRFSAQRNDIANEENKLATYNNAPVNVSWGGNNRTTAIRIPVSTYDETTRHIEHRVAGADANPEQVINAILEGIYIGLKEKIIPPEKIYGNAFDDQYNFLVPFPKSLKEANL